MKFSRLSQCLKNQVSNNIVEDRYIPDTCDSSLGKKKKSPSTCENNLFATTSKKYPKTKVTFWIRVCLSLFVLVPSLFIILDGSYQDDTGKWAFGTVGTILGYWLKE